MIAIFTPVERLLPLKRKANTKARRKKHRLRKYLLNLMENGLVNFKPFFLLRSFLNQIGEARFYLFRLCVKYKYQ